MLRRALPIRAASAATLAFALVGISAPVTQAGQPKAQTSADDVTELTQITSAYLQKRADSVTAAGAQQRALSAPADVTRTLASELEDDFAALADQGRILREVNGGYTRAEVDVTPGQTNVEGDIATLEVTEDTRLYYPNVEEGDPEYEEYSLPHTLTFKRSADGDWLLAGDRAEVDPAGPAPTTQLTDPMSEPAPDSEDEGAKEPGAASDPATGTGVGAKADATYNYTKMVAYANKHWKKANSDYRLYGNDCTNFISQAMRAGGWKATSGSFSTRKDNKRWFYGSHTSTTSYTWAGAENWYWFASKHSKRTKMLNNVWKMRSADVLQADWKRDGIIDHTMIVTKNSKGELYLTYHTPSTHNKKLSTILAKYPRAAWYAHST
ncbi:MULTISPECIES: amidase domain-containing protein [Streptomyces]|uniref:Putative amidase domain-containing protein n=1 Tax=Streptomyces badius TaxID=1941 RepID=A0ABQ2TGP3_STRBA|nr:MULTISPECIES: amidase domain-containing protein [Streptomyces]GGS67472.1 hypothetical protein GCM10010253_47950 [Streptomyces badius]